MSQDARSSLEKLQALEKDYATLEEQLDALAFVVGLGSQQPETLDNTNKAANTVPQHSLGKASFALRWLLAKLQTDHICRTSPKSWQLLAQSIILLPPSTATRFLKSHEFLKILETALEEAFPAHLARPTEQQDLQTDGDHKHGAIRSLATEEDDEENTSLGKRKRKSPQDGPDKKARVLESTANGSPETLLSKPHISWKHDDLLLLFLSMSSCLKNVVTPENEQAAQQYLPALKTSPDSMCKIMGGWLRALCVLLYMQRPAFAGQRVCAVLDPALRLWRLHSHAIETSSFSRYALLPALSLTALLSKCKTQFRNLETDDVPALTGDLERLIARHLLVPARRAFHDSRKSDAMTTDVDLAKLLEPISNQYRQPSHSAAERESLQFSSHNLSLATCLFSIAIRSAPRSSVQKRLSEQPWLERVFLVLVQRLDSDKSRTRRSRQSLEELGSMLRLAKRHDVNLTRSLLRDLTTTFGGISAASSEPQWSLLAKVIALDQQALLDSTSHSKTGQSTPLQLLFDAISSRAPQYDQTEGNERITGRYHYTIVKNGIIRPLMRAHATARDLTGFLHHWLACLVAVEVPQIDYSISVWEDPDLKVTLSDIMEVSMTTTSIVVFVQGLASDLSLTELDQDPQKRCSASAHVIGTILQAAHSDELVSQLLPLAEGFVSTTLRLLYSGRANSLRVRSALWQLLAVSFHLWASAADANDISAHPVVSGRKPPLARCGELLHRPRDILEALVCLLGMHEDLRGRHMEAFATNIEAGIQSALYCYMSEPDLSKYEVATFAAVVAKYPHVVELSRHKKKSAAVAKTGTLEHLADRACHYIGAGKTNDLSSAGSMLQSAWVTLVERLSGPPSDKAHLLQTIHNGITSDRRLYDLSLLQVLSSTREKRQDSDLGTETLKRLSKSDTSTSLDDRVRGLSLLYHVLPRDSKRAVGTVNYENLQQLAKQFDTAMMKEGQPLPENVEKTTRTWRQSCSLFEALALDCCRHLAKTSNKSKDNRSRDLLKHLTNNDDYHGPFLLSLITSTLAAFPAPDNPAYLQNLVPWAIDAARNLLLAGKRTPSVLLPLQQLMRIILAALHRVSFLEYDKLRDFAKILRHAGHDIGEDYATALELRLPLVEGERTKADLVTDLASCTSQAQQSAIRAFLIQAFETDTDAGRHDIISKILEVIDQAPDERFMTDSLHLLHAVTFRSSRPKREHLIPSELVPGVVASLTDRLPALTSYKAFLYASSNINLLLRYHARSVDQHSVESTLAATFAASTGNTLILDPTPDQQKPSQSLQENAAKVYAHLTALLQAILTLHRRRLIDRSHLLLPPLQSLLRCLFNPPPSLSSTKPPDFMAYQPAWLRRHNLLTAESAASYSRLLTAWADPSPSAVAPPRSKSRRSEASGGRGKDESLVNHTMLARKHAGQFAPYIILELCRLQLEGRLVDESYVSPSSSFRSRGIEGDGQDDQDDDYSDELKPQQAQQSMRDALRPGIYALFDAMALVESGNDERGKRRAFVDVVARDEAGVWGVTAGVRTVLRGWWSEWRQERGIRG